MTIVNHRVAVLLLALFPFAAFAQQPPAPQTSSSWTAGPYAYDGSGNIVSIGRASGAADTFTYDGFGRLTAASVAGQTQQYSYDRFGNLRSITTSNTTVTLGVDPASNQLSRSTDADTREPVNAWATYDAAGRLKQWQTSGGTFEYDALDMLESSSGVPGDTDKVYLYTSNDERIATISIVNGSESSSEWTLRDASGKVLRRLDKVRDGSQWKWRWRQDYIYLNGQPLASEIDTREKTLHFFPDHLGTPRLITGNGGVRVAEHAYLPFGAEITPSNQDAERLKFTGHERDGSALDYMHARYYSAGIGRFLSVDPTWESADLGRPQSWNRYTYVLDNPVRYSDPDGRMTPVPRMLTPEELAAQNELAAVATAAGGGLTAKFIADYVLEDGSGMEGSTADLPTDPAERAKYIERHFNVGQPGGPKKGSSGGPGAGKNFSDKTKNEARAESNNKCVFCGTETTRSRGPNQSNIDHAIAKARDGNNTLLNAQNTCRTCNLRKAVKSTLEYLDTLIKKVF